MLEICRLIHEEWLPSFDGDYSTEAGYFCNCYLPKMHVYTHTETVSNE